MAPLLSACRGMDDGMPRDASRRHRLTGSCWQGQENSHWPAESCTGGLVVGRLTDVARIVRGDQTPELCDL